MSHIEFAASFLKNPREHVQQAAISERTIHSFGSEWQKFQYKDEADFTTASKEYFDIVDLKALSPDTIAVDVGCGTGRWLRVLAPHVRLIFGIDPSEALEVAKENTRGLNNFVPINALAENLPFRDQSIDYAMSLGVLHHIHDTDAALAEISRILKPGGQFLFYFYYRLDNKPWWFRTLFHLTNSLRRLVSSMPAGPKDWICEFLAFTIYLPLVTLARGVERIFGEKAASALPLSYYRNKNLYVIRTDARDRFGTPLEKRFTKDEIESMLRKHGFDRVNFSSNVPYWHGICVKS